MDDYACYDDKLSSHACLMAKQTVSALNRGFPSTFRHRTPILYWHISSIHIYTSVIKLTHRYLRFINRYRRCLAIDKVGDKGRYRIHCVSAPSPIWRCRVIGVQSPHYCAAKKDFERIPHEGRRLTLYNQRRCILQFPGRFLHLLNEMSRDLSHPLMV